MGELGNAYKILVENPKERGDSEDLGVDGRIILECVLGKYGGRVDWIHLAQDGD
jgi:hypothetical protein